MSLVINADSCSTIGPKDVCSAYDFLRKNLLKQSHLARSMAVNYDSNLKSLEFLLDKRVSTDLLKSAVSLLTKQEESLGLLLEDISKIVDLVSTPTAEKDKADFNCEGLDSDLSYLWARVTYHNSKFSRDLYYDLCLRLSSGTLLNSRNSNFNTMPELLCSLKSVFHLPDLSKVFSLLVPLAGKQVSELNADQIGDVFSEISALRMVVSAEASRMRDHPKLYLAQLSAMRECLVREHMYAPVTHRAVSADSFIDGCPQRLGDLPGYFENVAVAESRGTHASYGTPQPLHH
tara:strand:+ start:727 stop:1596 length:870 start_codon:yes stop_codon:yes gene_type:complete